MIGHIFREQLQTLLKNSIYHVNEFDIDYWSVSHFVLYALFGFIKPKYAFSFFTAGVVFEIIEDGMASDSTTQLIKCKKDNIKTSRIGSVFCNGYKDSYWYGKLDDIFINLLGYTVGQGIRNSFF